MPKIVDPDQLNDATEIVIATGPKTIQLVVAGNLSDAAPGKSSGVTVQAVYSKLKELWKDTAAYNKYKFPMKAIFEAKFELINGWTWADQQTRDLLRDGGWRDTSDNSEFACIISLGTVNAPGSDLAYYQQIAGFDQTTTNFDKTGELNEGVQTWDGAANDYRGFLKVYLRVQGKLYAQGNLLVDQDLAALTYQAYRLPLANATDIKVTQSDAFIDANSPYTGMTLDFLKGSGFTTWANSVVYPAGAVVLDPIRQANGSSNGTWWFTPAGGTSSGTGTADDVGVTDWESYAGEVQIGAEWFAFNRLITGNNGTAEQIYEWAQRELRRTTNINDNGTGAPNQNGFGTVNGNVAVPLLTFLGDTLQTRAGVLITGFDVNDQNRIEFFDITVDGGGLDSESVPVTSTKRTYPFVAAGNIVFSSNLDAEPNPDTLYRMYYTYLQRSGPDTNFAITGAGVGGAHKGTLDSTGGPDLSHILSGQHFLMAGWANADNNGVATADANFSATGGAFTMEDTGRTVVNEAAGPSVTVDWEPFDSAGAVTVNNDAGSPIEGQITATSIAFDFDYDGNVQGGRTPATDASVTVVAQGLGGAEWISGAFTITRATGLSFPVNAPDERNYSNP